MVDAVDGSLCFDDIGSCFAQVLQWQFLLPIQDKDSIILLLTGKVHTTKYNANNELLLQNSIELPSDGIECI